MDASMPDIQTRYARAAALVSLRLPELTDALRHHEANPANWRDADALIRVESALGRLVDSIANPPDQSSMDPAHGARVPPVRSQ